MSEFYLPTSSLVTENSPSYPSLLRKDVNTSKGE